MTADEQRRVALEIVATIERGIRSKRWLYWPPGPMLGQVFDRDLCLEDVRYALTKFPTVAEGDNGVAENPSDVRGTESTGSPPSDSSRMNLDITKVD